MLADYIQDFACLLITAEWKLGKLTRKTDQTKAAMQLWLIKSFMELTMDARRPD